MSTTQRDHIRELVAELDSLVPREGARICLQVYGGGPDESRVVANEGGYLRFGIEFLKAGLCSPVGSSPGSMSWLTAGKGSLVECDLEGLLTEASDVHFESFVLSDEDGGRDTASATPRLLLAIVGQAGCLLAGLGLLALVIVGLGTVLDWAF